MSFKCKINLIINVFYFSTMKGAAIKEPNVVTLKKATLKMTGKGCVFCFLFWISILCCPCSIIAQQRRPILAFASDTQQPLSIEHVMRKLDHNEQAT